MDDLARQVDAAIREALARLVGVVDGAIDAVAEPELAREMNEEPAAGVLEVVGAHSVDERAVVSRGEFARDRFLHVEALAEYQGLGGAHQLLPGSVIRARGKGVDGAKLWHGRP